MARKRSFERLVIILLFMICLLAAIWLVEYGNTLVAKRDATAMVSGGSRESGPASTSSGQAIEVINSDIEIYFCPRDSCEERLFELLDSARVSIHCATYEMDLPRIISLLDYKSRAGLDVKVVVDGDYYNEVQNMSWVRHDNRSAFMHNKFCIVDGKEVYTGSMNPTTNCAYKNNNNLVLIESAYLSQNYEAEFEELWNGQFGKGGRVPFPVIGWNNITIKNYFCPEDDCRGKVRAEIQKANSSIYFMAFSFTDDFIGRDLVIKKAEGIDVRGVFEKTKLSNYSEYNLLKYQGIDVRTDTNKYNLHHKVFIIDNRTVVTGSFNPSSNANFENDENLLVIEDNKVAGLFLMEFSSLAWT